MDNLETFTCYMKNWEASNKTAMVDFPNQMVVKHFVMEFNF